MVKQIKHIILLGIFGLAATIGFGQDFQWVNSKPIVEGNSPGQYTSCMTTSPDGNIMFSGLQEAKVGGYGNIFFQKVDPEGELIREVVLYGKGKPPAKMVTDDMGNLYFSLLFTDDMTWAGDTIQAFTSQTNLALVKLDTAFRLVWVQYPDGAVNNNTPLCLEDGLIYTSMEKSWDTTVIQIMDTSGSVLSEIYQENTGYLSSIDVDTAGNIYAVGSCTSTEAVFNGVPWPPPPFPYNFYLVKYGTDRQPLWVKYLEDVTCISAEVKVSGENHIYLSGMLTTEKDFDDLHLDGPSWVYDFFVSRLNSDGDFLWAREVPGVLSGDATLGTSEPGNLSFMDSDTDHNVYLTGMIRGTIDWGNGIVTESTDNYYDILTWSYTADGEMQYAVSVGGVLWDYGHSISAGHNGDVYLSGTATQTVNFGDIVVEEEGMFSFVSRFGYDPTAIEQKRLVSNLIIYPNPVSTSFEILLEEKSELHIFDVSGQIVFRQSLAAGRNTVDVSTLPRGLYFAVASGNAHQSSGKFIRE